MEHYLLDTNVFIQSSHTLPDDIFPSYWTKLGEVIESGIAIIHESVLDELKKHKDPLLDWVKSLEGVKIFKSSPETLQCYLAVCNWADKDGRYTAKALRDFKKQGLLMPGYAQRRWHQGWSLQLMKLHRIHRIVSRFPMLAQGSARSA